jgi:hypothetical protein
VYIKIKPAALSYPPLDTLFEGAPKPKRQKTAESSSAESSSLSCPSSSMLCAESEAAYKDIDSCFIGLFNNVNKYLA